MAVFARIPRSRQLTGPLTHELTSELPRHPDPPCEAYVKAMKEFQDNWNVSYMKALNDFQSNWNVSYMKNQQDNWNVSYMKTVKDFQDNWATSYVK